MKLNSILLGLVLTSRTAVAFSPSSQRSIVHQSTRLFSSSSQTEETIQNAFDEHQKNAPRPGMTEDVRSLVQYNHGFSVLSTNSKKMDGYPNGSVAQFAVDEEGSPIFFFSSLAQHTQDLLADPRCSVTIASKDFKGMSDGRVNLVGQAKVVPEDEIESLKEIFKKKHPDVFWMDFMDFSWFRMEIEDVYSVGGFGRIGHVNVDEYRAAKPDPIMAFGGHIANHMNEDHMDSTIAMIESQVPGLKATDAQIASVDSLGMFVKVTRTPEGSEEEQKFNMRLPFPREAKDRKDVKNVIVEMTRAAAGASQ
jgi:putative heme iron utilization protein